jgi:hypothetical protein
MKTVTEKQTDRQAYGEYNTRNLRGSIICDEFIEI